MTTQECAPWILIGTLGPAGPSLAASNLLTQPDPYTSFSRVQLHKSAWSPSTSLYNTHIYPDTLGLDQEVRPSPPCPPDFIPPKPFSAFRPSLTCISSVQPQPDLSTSDTKLTKEVHMPRSHHKTIVALLHNLKGTEMPFSRQQTKNIGASRQWLTSTPRRVLCLLRPL